MPIEGSPVYHNDSEVVRKKYSRPKSRPPPEARARDPWAREPHCGVHIPPQSPRSVRDLEAHYHSPSNRQARYSSHSLFFTPRSIYFSLNLFLGQFIHRNYAKNERFHQGHSWDPGRWENAEKHMCQPCWAPSLPEPGKQLVWQPVQFVQQY